MTIGQRIKQKRKERQLTLKQIEALSRLTVGNLSEIENDKYLPSVPALMALSEVLNVSIDWIIYGNEHPEENSDDEKFALSNKLISENELIFSFNKLSITDKFEIIDMINMKNSRSKIASKIALKKQENIVDKTNKDRNIFFE